MSLRAQALDDDDDDDDDNDDDDDDGDGDGDDGDVMRSRNLLDAFLSFPWSRFISELR